ncbi:FAD binding domain-containing protein [Streptomyces sp. NPDC048606]|uniref:FAD binding domain-containing protein n=1 Tax=Streptomyces sp. NPDC048606 TaxID=3154726 RepID=UPI003441B7EE
MLLRLPTSVSEAQECMAEGAVPIGGATLVWATWQRDGFPAQAMSLRDLPEANGIGAETLGAAVVLNRVDDRVPEVLRKAAAGVGTGAVRRTATVGGNLVGSTLRCLLPAALVLDARAVILEPEGVHTTDLAEVLAKRHLLLSLGWRTPIASNHHKAPDEAGGPPPLVVAAALHREEGGQGGHRRLRVAVRDEGELFGGGVRCHATAEEDLRALREGRLARLSDTAWEVVRRQVTELLTPPAGGPRTGPGTGSAG